MHTGVGEYSDEDAARAEVEKVVRKLIDDIDVNHYGVESYMSMEP